MSRSRDVADGTLATADINGGNIDNTTIGGTDPAAGTFTTVTSTGLAVDTNVLYVDSTANTVGIGTSTPASGVSVSQSALEISHSNVAALALTSTHSPTGKKYTLYSGSGGDLVVYDTTDNAARMLIDSSGNVELANSLTAGTIGTGVTINAGSNVSGINQLVGISWNGASITGETAITVENNKSYVGVLFAWETSVGYSIPPELFRFSVNGSGIVTTTTLRSWSGSVDVSTSTNTITADVFSNYQWATLLLFEEGQTIDTV